LGQNRCFSDEEAKKVVELLQSPAATSENKKIRKELVEMRDEVERFHQKISKDVEKNRELIPAENALSEKHLVRVCQIIRENGWLTKDVLKDDGFAAFEYLISSNRAYALQREMLPVLAAAAKKGYIGNPLIASLVDSIRIGAGFPQIFGTQAAIRNDVIYLFPLLNENKIDEWRKIYDLPPLTVLIRTMEMRYSLPVLKSQRLSTPPGLSRKSNEKNADTAILGISNDDSETVKVETRLVNLNIRILTQDLKPPTGINLTKDDFIILEDGVEQTPVFFSAADQPFDLVLLLDFSGSTFAKRGLIKKAAERFVEYARAGDRIAIVVFTHEIRIISDLTMDKNELVQRIKAVDMNGGSRIWDSLRFTYDNILKKESAGRRSAVVFMTDGEDGSRDITFTDLMETVRHGDTTIFSVWLSPSRSNNVDWQERYGRQTLSLLAEESGGQFYAVHDLKDLNGTYEQVINDLGKVYSIGYEPKNETRDGGWRNLTVKIKASNLVGKTRRGYYAN